MWQWSIVCVAVFVGEGSAFGQTYYSPSLSESSSTPRIGSDVPFSGHPPSFERRVSSDSFVPTDTNIPFQAIPTAPNTSLPTTQTSHSTHSTAMRSHAGASSWGNLPSGSGNTDTISDITPAAPSSFRFRSSSVPLAMHSKRQSGTYDSLSPPSSTQQAVPRSIDPRLHPVRCETEHSYPRMAHCERPFRTSMREEYRRVCDDHRNFYRWSTLWNYSLALGGGAVLANSPLDGDFQNWYQDDVRSSGTDDFASFVKTFGEGHIFIPSFAIMTVTGRYLDQRNPCSSYTNSLTDFASRTTRGYLVGAPSLLFGQYALGASRPCDHRPWGSKWQPFQDENSISGHAFIGATPFITAAQMSESKWLKGTFYLCSTMTAWSRVNDDKHYLSQICLGWYLSYLSCRAVSQTEGGWQGKGLTLFPLIEPEGVGMGIHYQR